MSHFAKIADRRVKFDLGDLVSPGAKVVNPALRLSNSVTNLTNGIEAADLMIHAIHMPQSLYLSDH